MSVHLVNVVRYKEGGVMKIIINRAKCLRCNDVIVSAHGHDFRYCKCGAIAVDGGHSYLKRTGERADCEEACVYDATPSPKEGECNRKWIIWSPNGATNPCVVFDRHEDAEARAKEMRDNLGGHWYVSLLQSGP